MILEAQYFFLTMIYSLFAFRLHSNDKTAAQCDYSSEKHLFGEGKEREKIELPQFRAATLLFLQNMGDNSGTAAADILGHGDVDIVELGLTRVAAQLQGGFGNLVEAGSADRMPACL